MTHTLETSVFLPSRRCNIYMYMYIYLFYVCFSIARTQSWRAISRHVLSHPPVRTFCLVIVCMPPVCVCVCACVRACAHTHPALRSLHAFALFLCLSLSGFPSRARVPALSLSLYYEFFCVCMILCVGTVCLRGCTCGSRSRPLSLSTLSLLRWFSLSCARSLSLSVYL